MIKEKFYDFNPNIKRIISTNIRKYRKLRGLTQEQLALYTELSYDFIRRIETSGGKSGFSVETLYKIATVLEVSMDELTKEEK
jgi:transcriptional regulator with XRE-family HTH domain